MARIPRIRFLGTSEATSPQYFHVPKILVREPRLMVPGQKPLGPVRIDWSHPLANGLVCCMELNEGYGTTTRDLAYDCNGTLSPAPQWTISSGNKALRFDGTDDRVLLTATGSLKYRPPTLPVTLMAWMSLDDPTLMAGRFAFVANYKTDVYCGPYMRAHNAAFAINYGDSTGMAITARRTKTDTSASFVAGKEYFICGVIRGATEMDLYINGVDVGGTYDGTGGAMAYDNSQEGRIGQLRTTIGGPTTYFDGTCSGVRLYNRALSQGEVFSTFLDRSQFLIPA